jgi:UDP-2,4-diacetamido-2,4,6-trideoxy-beta-L-altropyranose hydrolase
MPGVVAGAERVGGAGLRIAFRADASTAIGTGHVMRCLALARVLAAAGHRCRFIARDLPGNLNHRIAQEGHALDVLPAPEGPAPVASAGDPPHAGWAGVGWARDAAETAALLAADPPDWLVVDHYAFDRRWEEAARPPGARLAVIDDLADRPHAAELLVDQNLGRRARDYDGLVPGDAVRLIGPSHALMRGEFATLRAAALAARRARMGENDGAPGRILVSMGGVDLPDATGAALRALGAAAGLRGARVTVVMGGGASALAAVRVAAAALPMPCEVTVDSRDMAALMARADLAIGGAGVTAWERCTLGLPAVTVTMAANQAATAAALETAGASVSAGEAGEGLEARLEAALRRLVPPDARALAAEAAAAICDGAGAGRVAAVLALPPIALRAATMADAEAVWSWRRAVAQRFFRAGETPPLVDHLEWFARALGDPGRQLLIAVGAEGEVVGHLRLDRDPKRAGTAALSILVDPASRGRGIGRAMLLAADGAARAAGLTRIEAEVHEDNGPSLAAFRAIGYEEEGTSGDYVRMLRRL